MKTLKILLMILSIGIIAAPAAFAYEAREHGAKNGLLGLPPEYIHVLLNPLPGYGLAMGLVSLTAALFVRSKPAQLIGISIVILSCAAAWPVMHYGTNAFEEIQEQADEAGKEWLDEHMERAENFIYFFYGTALLGIAALVYSRRFPKAATPLAVATLIAGAASLGAAGWISKAGGQIRHSEFRQLKSSESTRETTEDPR